MAELLRASHEPVDPNEMMHSPLTLQLREGVIECEYIFQASLARVIAYSALNSHPHADLEKAGPKTHANYLDALSTIPYLTGGKSGEDMIRAERLDFVNRFNQYRDRVLKGKKDATAGSIGRTDGGYPRVGVVGAK